MVICVGQVPESCQTDDYSSAVCRQMFICLSGWALSRMGRAVISGYNSSVNLDTNLDLECAGRGVVDKFRLIRDGGYSF